MRKIIKASYEAKTSKKAVEAATGGANLGGYEPYYRLATMDDIADLGEDTSNYQQIGSGVLSQGEIDACQNYGIDPIGIVVAKEEFAEALGNNSYDILIAASDGGSVTLMQMVGSQGGDRLYDISLETIEQSVMDGTYEEE